jgi:hypothetical protein
MATPEKQHNWLNCSGVTDRVISILGEDTSRYLRPHIWLAGGAHVHDMCAISVTDDTCMILEEERGYAIVGAKNRTRLP